MKSIIFCFILAMLAQYGQSRQLLVAAAVNAPVSVPAGEKVKCNTTTSEAICSDYAPTDSLTDVWRWDGQRDVMDNATNADKQASCCVIDESLANSTCADIASSCGLDRVLLPNPHNRSVDGKLLVQAENSCCEPAFTANDNCTALAITCPVKSAARSAVAGQLVGVAKSDDAAQLDKCCVALPACDETKTCAEGMTTMNSSYTPDTEDARESYCCVYPANATCADVSPAVNGSEALNCTNGPIGAYDFEVAAPLAYSKGAAVPVSIMGKNFFGALDMCCEKVQYAANTTCGLNFDCAKVAPLASMISNPLMVNSSLAGFNIANETGVAAICCKAPPAPENNTITDTCADLDIKKATMFTGKATLVANSSAATCNMTCVTDADLTIYINGTCRTAVFKPTAVGCPTAMGVVTLDAKTGTMASISGAFSESDDAFAVTPVTGVAKQVTITMGETCSAKFILDDALLAKLEAPTKNSATGKAASFLAAVLALLAMLVL